jgi:hypothetical protein
VPRLTTPSKCHLWHAEAITSNDLTVEQFAIIETYSDEEHFRRQLRRCKSCSQLYFYEFFETSGPDGDDPQYSTYVPVETQIDIEALKQTDHWGLLDFSRGFKRIFRLTLKGPSSTGRSKLPEERLSTGEAASPRRAPPNIVEASRSNRNSACFHNGVVAVCCSRPHVARINHRTF